MDISKEIDYIKRSMRDFGLGVEQRGVFATIFNILLELDKRLQQSDMLHHVHGTDPAEPELKPCPFCGFTVIRWTNNTIDGRSYFCNNCYVSTDGYGTLDEAKKAWNRRS